MKNNIKRISIYLLMMLAISACNTMEGAGEDVEEAGDEIEDATN